MYFFAINILLASSYGVLFDLYIQISFKMWRWKYFSSVLFAFLLPIILIYCNSATCFLMVLHLITLSKTTSSQIIAILIVSALVSRDMNTVDNPPAAYTENIVKAILPVLEECRIILQIIKTTENNIHLDADAHS